MATRREFISGSAPAIAGAALGSSNANATAALAPANRDTQAVQLSDLSFLRNEPLANRERASAILKAEGLDAMVVARSHNVFYLTNYWPLIDRMGISATSCLAVITADAKRPIALIVPAFSYYYIQADDGLLPGVQPFVFTGPAGSALESGAAAPVMMRVTNEAGLSARERRRRAAIAAAAPYHASAETALRAALRELGIKGGAIGVDETLPAGLVAAVLPNATTRMTEDTLRRVRLIRTPTELRLQRIAAQNNVDAAMATAKAARSLGSLRAMRARFYAECALRGNGGVFMVVDSVSSDAYDETLREGQSFLIDGVSQCRNYHGDFARTVHFGEPSKRMLLATEAIGKTWDELRSRVRPGMRFSEIRTLGDSILRKLNYDVSIGFGPHSVGLAHTDQPRSAVGGGPVDHVIEVGMVLSIDNPLFEVGYGSAHLEDLILIKPDGAETIHSVPPRTITV